MHASSSYNHESYLPNKPDIVAPGTRIRVVQSTTGTSNFYYSNGAESTGTSFAAPIVTGIVAQMQQAGVLGFKRWPGLVKSVLATSADPTLTTLTPVARFLYALMDLSKRIGLN